MIQRKPDSFLKVSGTPRETQQNRSGLVQNSLLWLCVRQLAKAAAHTRTHTQCRRDMQSLRISTKNIKVKSRSCVASERMKYTHQVDYCLVLPALARCGNLFGPALPRNTLKKCLGLVQIEAKHDTHFPRAAQPEISSTYLG